MNSSNFDLFTERFFFSLQDQTPIQYYPPRPEDTSLLDEELEDNLEEYAESIPSATSKDEKDDDAKSASGDEIESSETEAKDGERRSKQLEDPEAPKRPCVVEGVGESSSAAPLSLKTIPMAPPLKRTPPTSTSTKCKFNDFGLPIESS